MKLTKTPFSRGGGKLRGLAVAAVIGMAPVATHGLQIVDCCPDERIVFTNRHVLVFRSSGSLTLPMAGTVDVLVVGGGGGGGMNNTTPNRAQQGGGGGGGGGVVYKTSLAVEAGTHQLVVGNGGAIGENGGYSSVFGITAYGGGAGAKYGGNEGNAGASGGGATSANSEEKAGGAAVHGEEGNLGYAGGTTCHVYGAGGGGGAGGVGGSTRLNPANNGYSFPGNGGDGVVYAIVGTNVCYGGGGAGYRSDVNATGGAGGGGSCIGGVTESGVDGLGGGGGGGSSGGSGVVIVSYEPSGFVEDSADFMLTGGDYPFLFENETVLVFTNSGTLTVSGHGFVEILAVGGGGGGGATNAYDYGCGGGGGGGVVHLTNLTVSAGTYGIEIGRGGAVGVNGGLTTALGVFAYGGGAGGGTAYSTDSPGGDGASGGGTSHRYSGTAIVPGGEPTCALYGNLGHAGGSSEHVYGSGGGGGAGAAGGNGSGSTPGAGGDGYNCKISGTGTYYGGGGAGYRTNNNKDSKYTTIRGGLGGGGAFGQPGKDGLGGGGSGNQPGGSGIVIIRFRKVMPWAAEFKDASGGVKTHIPGYDIHTFTSDGMFTMPCAGKVEVLLVGGGGGGGVNNSSYGGGGGGGGGVVTNTFVLPAGTHAVNVGAGGNVGENGGDTVAFHFTAYGGGAGAKGNSASPGKAGASGGGAASNSGSDPVVLGGAAIYGEGAGDNCGHDGGGANHRFGSGGGGGAGEPGGGNTGETKVSTPGAGGDGIISGITGTATYYGGGGAGFRSGNFPAVGGKGGGGANDGDTTPNPGTDGLGGGGNGGARGGSGIVIIRYKLPQAGTQLFFR